MTLKPRERALLALFVVVGLVWGVTRLSRRWSSDPGLEPFVGGLTGQRRGARGASEQLTLEVEQLRLDDLERQTGEFRPGRDPWRFAPVARPPEVSKPEPVERPSPEPVVEAKPEPERPKPPEVDVVYLGSFGPGSRKIAVFSDGETIYNALTGDVLRGRFVVHQIGYESVDLKFVGFPDVPPTRLAVGG